MLLCNEKLVEPTGSSAPAKFLKDCYQQMDQLLGWPIKLKFPDTHKHQITLVDQFGNESKGYEYSKGFGILASLNYRGANGTERWTYYTDSRPIPGSSFVKYFPKRISLSKREFKLEQSDRELAFFLIFISGHCEVVDGLVGQNADKKKTYLMLDDKVRIAKKEEQARIKEYKVFQALYGEGALDDNTLRTLAKAYFIDDTADAAVIKNQLFNIVTKSNDKDAVDRFISAIDLPDDVRVRALVKTARDLNVIVLRKSKEWKKWHLVNDDGTDGDLIVSCSLTAREMSVLTEFLTKAPVIVATIEENVAAKMKGKK